MKVKRVTSIVFVLIVIASLLAVIPAAAAPQPTSSQAFKAPKARWTESVAFDVSPALRDLPKAAAPQAVDDPDAEPVDIRPDRGAKAEDNGFSGDGAAAAAPSFKSMMGPTASIQAPLANFEGISNQDNFNIFGFRVNPPDPVGDVGPNHYVEMVNLAYAVYDKQGNLLLGPVDTGTLWAGFPVDRLHRSIR